jgi:hypothetical protein
MRISAVLFISPLSVTPAPIIEVVAAGTDLTPLDFEENIVVVFKMYGLGF